MKREQGHAGRERVILRKRTFVRSNTKMPKMSDITRRKAENEAKK